MVKVQDKFKKDYKKQSSRNIILTIFLILATAILFVYSLCISQYPINFSEAFDILIANLKGESNPSTFVERTKNNIVWTYNVPRAIAGVTVGAILAVGGAVMQSMVRNPLASPYTTGISSGAYFGVTIYVVLGISVLPLTHGGMEQIINAFVFALIPATAIFTISSIRKTSPTMMVLIGIGVMYLFSASSTMLKVIATPDALSEIYTWGVGFLGKVTWDNTPILVTASIFLIVCMMLMYKKINIIASDDKLSTTLGINPSNTRMILLIVISLATAVAVCFTGTIGFVGLVAPHIARIFVGSNARYLIPFSASAGSFMLLAADCIARNVGTGVPVGVVTALIGSPLFLYFLIRQKKNVWN